MDIDSPLQNDPATYRMARPGLTLNPILPREQRSTGERRTMILTIMAVGRRLRPAVFAVLAATALPGCGAIKAEIHDPRSLPTLAQDSRVHYQPGSQDDARTVAAMLAQAMRTVEAAQGGPFGGPFTVTTYRDQAAYAAASGGGGSGQAMAMTYFDRISISPQLLRKHRPWLQQDLTVELSHEHFWGHLSTLTYFRLPIWFVEGVGVMVSQGGGAQLVSDDEARRALCAGAAVEVTDDPPLLNNFGFRPVPVSNPSLRFRMQMAYRQSGLFVTNLRQSDGKAFAELMRRLYAGEHFANAFTASYGVPLWVRWNAFLQATQHACAADALHGNR